MHIQDASAPVTPAPAAAPGGAVGVGQQVLLAFACAMVAMGVRYLLDPALGDRQPYAPAYAAIAVAAWFGTWRAGLFCAVLSQLWANYLFIAPRGAFTLTAEDAIGAIGFYAIAGVLLSLGHLAKQAIAVRDALLLQLREGEHRRTRLLATLAHELRDPLQAARQAADLCTSDRAPGPARAHAQAVLHRQLEQIERLANDLMDTASLQQGKLTLRLRDIDVAHLVAMGVETSRPNFDRRDQRIQVNLPARPATARVDPDRMVQVLSNLLDNASKYSPSGAAVTLDVSVDGRDLVVEVIDRGRGFDPAQGDAIFEPFTQLVPGSEGLGLGLPLVRQLVRLHGGTVTGRSDGVGTGAVFCVRIPGAVSDTAD
ncbi:MAG: sensor histidine kinase [Ramlibacter sp.]